MPHTLFAVNNKELVCYNYNIIIVCKKGDDNIDVHNIISDMLLHISTKITIYYTSKI